MTTQLRATPARVALLQAVESGDVTYDMLGANYYDHSAERTVTGEIHKMMDAGWVVRLAAEEPELTAAGRAVLDHATTEEQQS